MRKVLMFAVGVLMAAGAATNAFAAVTSVSKATFPAGITFEGTGDVRVSAALNTGTSFAWTEVSAGETAWKAASNYIVMHSTITSATGGIQIYTDNKATASGFEPYNGDRNPAGLVDQNAPGTDPLPMCWRIVDTSTNTLTIVQDATTNLLYSAELGQEFPCFMWFKDLNTPDLPETNTEAFEAGEPYVTVKDRSGIHYAGGDDEFGVSSSPDYIYVGANFLGSATPGNYKGTIKLEAFIE